mmetsp:Transcript_97368/g.270840  ORF Transcript_97368/g.270840 Transcript_97368/m.270840 type:complete len:602 (+) Transcript_97368:84-1889(+)
MAAAEKAKKVCYYELLGLDRRCEAAEIKSSYRKLALKMHPDKAHQNDLTVEEATKRFQQIQEAYSVLSDAQERAWYDAHREQILRGDDEPGEDPFKTKINLYKYFSTSCFDGFGAGPRSFFTVYTELFEAIDTEEAEWEDADDEHTTLPPFGGPDAEWDDVSAFYRHWLDFCSRKAFGHADKWNPKEAQNRQVRRAMEQENKKARQAAKKEFNAEVRQLVRFVQKRDPRVAARQKQQMKATVEQTQRELAGKEKRKAAEAQERQQRKEAARLADEERWAEVAANREARRARGEIVSEDESSEKASEAFEYRCEACRKSFKSEKAFEQHEKSKKHQQVVAQLRRELELELEAEAEAEEEEPDLEAGVDSEAEAESDAGQGEGVPAGGGRETAERTADGEEEQDGEVSEDEDNEDDFIARFAAFRPPPRAPAPGRGGDTGSRGDGGTGAASRGEVRGNSTKESGEFAIEGGIEGGSTSSNDDAGITGIAAGGGKRAQKREKQRALLLERKAEKDSAKDRRKGSEAQSPLPDEADEAAEGAAEGAEPAQPQPTGPAVDAGCAVCGERFPSRSKLFQHIKASGHAALKPAPAAQTASTKGRKKKR